MAASPATFCFASSTMSWHFVHDVLAPKPVHDVLALIK
jgi:hypothetical protein